MLGCLGNGLHAVGSTHLDNNRHDAVDAYGIEAVADVGCVRDVVRVYSTYTVESVQRSCLPDRPHHARTSPSKNWEPGCVECRYGWSAEAGTTQSMWE